MAYNFSAAERYAVWTVHNERCWLCRNPVGLLEVEVDHVIPEWLLDDPGLPKILNELGLPADYDLNSFDNWMPAHSGCNGRKRGTVFHPSPMVQVELQSAGDKANRAELVHDTYVTDRKLSRAINILLAAREIGGFSEKHERMLARIVVAVAQEHESNRNEQERGTPLFLAPWLEVVREDANWLTLRGPGGLIGLRPKAARPDASWDCPRCGVTGWNGARCVVCGMLDDGD